MSRRPSYHQFCVRVMRRPVPGMNCHRPEAEREYAIGLNALTIGSASSVGRPRFDLLDDVEE
jgi:hypothetical protein